MNAERTSGTCNAPLKADRCKGFRPSEQSCLAPWHCDTDHASVAKASLHPCDCLVRLRRDRIPCHWRACHRISLCKFIRDCSRSFAARTDGAKRFSARDYRCPARSRCTSEADTVANVEALKNISISDDGSVPVNAVIGAMFRRCGESAWFNALWIKGSSSSHFSRRRQSSEEMARKAQKSSLPSRSTALLL